MNSKVKIVLGFIAGGALGFAYYYFVGCRSGSCPLTGNPYISTLYGSAVGALLISGFRKRDNQKSPEEEK